MASSTDDRVTAAVLIIGDEILSGRTQDTNLRDIARYLGVHGVDRLGGGVVTVSRTGRGEGSGESLIAAPLEAVAKAHPAMSLGSYPFFSEGMYGSNLVLRGRDPDELASTVDELMAALQSAG